jgi:hypothetical protein
MDLLWRSTRTRKARWSPLRASSAAALSVHSIRLSF